MTHTYDYPMPTPSLDRETHYEVWRYDARNGKTDDFAYLSAPRREVAQRECDDANAEEAENARLEMRRTRVQFYVVEATTIRKVLR